MIKRYFIENEVEQPYEPNEIEDKNGDWVKWDDVKHLVFENEKLRAMVDGGCGSVRPKSSTKIGPISKKFKW